MSTVLHICTVVMSNPNNTVESHVFRYREIHVCKTVLRVAPFAPFAPVVPSFMAGVGGGGGFRAPALLVPATPITSPCLNYSTSIMSGGGAARFLRARSGPHRWGGWVGGRVGGWGEWVGCRSYFASSCSVRRFVDLPYQALRNGLRW